MEKRFFQIFCVLKLTAVIYGITGKGDTSYDVKGLITKSALRYENSLRARDHGVLHQFKFGGIDEDPRFEPTGDLLRNSSQCWQDISYTLHNIKSPWALKLFDSFGKPESGILQGNMKWVGDYYECLEVSSINPNSSTVGNFRGKYCTVSQKTGEQAFSFGFSTAICIPDSCSGEELEEDVIQLLRIAGVVFPALLNETTALEKKIQIKCKPAERHLNGGAIAMIVLLSLIFVLTLTGSSITAYKYFKSIAIEYERKPHIGYVVDNRPLIEDEKNTIMKSEEGDNTQQVDNTHPSIEKEILLLLKGFLNCFCVFTNGSKILNTSTSEGELLCVHGIRFLSMSWVMLGHTYLFGIAEMKNIASLFDYLNTFLFQIILQGFYSVDSFFVLSGFLLSYLVMNEFAKSRGHVFWPYFYIHRFIRLTPTYMLILAFSATIYMYLGSGPYWPDGDVDKNCHKYWWQNLLYINNFFDQSEQCMGWSWYLANDMQFFIISPLFLLTLWWYPIIGFVLISVFLLICWLSNFLITYEYELMAGVFNVSQAALASLSKFTESFDKIYIKPYTRISPYLIGILTGYFLHKRKAKNYPKHDLVFLSVGWIISIGVGLACVFGLYHQNPSLIGNSFYNAFYRMAFSLSLAWVIYACLVGQGGVVNRILSWKFFIPLSRLTYVAYLIHPMIITGYFASMKTSIAFNHPMLVYLFLGFLVATYTLALPVALILESPIIAVDKWIIKGVSKKKRKGFVIQQTNEIED